MNKRFTLTLVAASLSTWAAFAFAHGEKERATAHKYDASKVEVTDFGQEGDPRKVTRTIRILMADSMRFTPADVSVKRGETIKFVVRNNGKLLHEMVLGTVEALKAHAELMKKFPEMEHADPNQVTVPPGKTGAVVWQFTRAGKVNFACLQPGHYDAGMKGLVKVAPGKGSAAKADAPDEHKH